MLAESPAYSAELDCFQFRDPARKSLIARPVGSELVSSNVSRSPWTSETLLSVHRRVQHNLPSRLRTAGKRNRRNRDVTGEAANDRRLAPFAEATPDPAAQRFRNVRWSTIRPPRRFAPPYPAALRRVRESVGAFCASTSCNQRLRLCLRDSGRTYRHRPEAPSKCRLSGVSGRHGSRLGQTKTPSATVRVGFTSILSGSVPVARFRSVRPE